jgi:hypothetical protein
VRWFCAPTLSKDLAQLKKRRKLCAAATSGVAIWSEVLP